MPILLDKMQKLSTINGEIKALKQFKTNTKNPICVIKVSKTRSLKATFEELKPLCQHIRILVAIDDQKNSLKSPYMIVWRVVNNIDATRDIYTFDESVMVDATNKSPQDGYLRDWPDDVDCTPSVIDDLKQKKLIDVDDEFYGEIFDLLSLILGEVNSYEKN